MTPRPAAPESPERVATLRELIAEIKQPLWRLAANARLDELERSEALAQTEIKGHMRVVDELKATVPSLERKLDDIVNTMKHAGMKVPGWIEHTDQDGRLRRDNLTIAATLVFELEAWQARIAELEKEHETELEELATLADEWSEFRIANAIRERLA